MKRRHFFATAASGSLLGILNAQSQEAPVEKDQVGFRSEPVLMSVTDTSVRVLALVKGLTRGWVEFGTTESLGSKNAAFNNGFLALEEKALQFELTNLKPGVRYFYKVCGIGVKYTSNYKAELQEAFESKVYSFKTLDPNAKEAHLTFWNDTHQNKETLSKLVQKHRKEGADLLIWNGDVTNDLTSESTVDEYVSPTPEGFAMEVPVHYSRGNHDVRGRYARRLSEYVPGVGGKYHYTFRQGPLACVVLDTGEDKPDAMENYLGVNAFTEDRKLQAEWLAKAIEEPSFKSAPFKVAIMHIPLFYDAEVPEPWWSVWNGFNGWICEEGRKLWHELLVKADIKMILSGHTHQPAVFPANAEHPYVQVTGGGPKSDIATVMKLHATSDKLVFTMEDLSGKKLHKLDFQV